MSDESWSPTCIASWGSTQALLNASWNIFGWGFSTPTSPEVTAKSKYGDSPRFWESSSPKVFMLEIIPRVRPCPLSMSNAGRTSSNLVSSYDWARTPAPNLRGLIARDLDARAAENEPLVFRKELSSTVRVSRPQGPNGALLGHVGVGKGVASEHAFGCKLHA